MDNLNILFATDFSPSARVCLKFIKKMQNLFKNSVCLVHVIPSFWKDWFTSGSYKNEALQRLITCQSELGKSSRNFKPVLLYGNPADVILKTAENKKTDLIVLGAKVSTVGGRYKTGTTTENVARHAKSSVWICKSDVVSNILCGIDGSESSAKALKFSMNLAKRFSASLCIVSALPSCDFNPFGMSDREIKKCEKESNQKESMKRDAFLEQFDFSDIKIEKHFIQGVSANVVLDRAEDFNHDLIVVGAKGHSLLHHVLIGSTAEKILRYAPCSLLIVR